LTGYPAGRLRGLRGLQRPLAGSVYPVARLEAALESLDKRPKLLVASPLVASRLLSLLRIVSHEFRGSFLP